MSKPARKAAGAPSRTQRRLRSGPAVAACGVPNRRTRDIPPSGNIERRTCEISPLCITSPAATVKSTIRSAPSLVRGRSGTHARCAHESPSKASSGWFGSKHASIWHDSGKLPLKCAVSIWTRLTVPLTPSFKTAQSFSRSLMLPSGPISSTGGRCRWRAVSQPSPMLTPRPIPNMFPGTPKWRLEQLTPRPPLRTEHKSISVPAGSLSQSGMTFPWTRRRAIPPSGNMLRRKCVMRLSPLPDTSKKWWRVSGYPGWSGVNETRSGHLSVPRDSARARSSADAALPI
mmetsp:Transcript_31173/g.53761  ORF Transcript_31173/g.53761 Transcript_31173/m.53761 type:complete len:287 (+) Transcript_31173:1408-2268(+)